MIHHHALLFCMPWFHPVMLGLYSVSMLVVLYLSTHWKFTLLSQSQCSLYPVLYWTVRDIKNNCWCEYSCCVWRRMCTLRPGVVKQHKNSNSNSKLFYLWIVLTSVNANQMYRTNKLLPLLHISSVWRQKGLSVYITLKVLNFWKFTSYCSLKQLWSGMGEVVPACTSPTLHPPSPPTVHQLSWLAL